MAVLLFVLAPALACALLGARPASTRTAAAGGQDALAPALLPAAREQPVPQLGWWVASPLARVLLNDTAPPPGAGGGGQHAALHAQRGEIESVMVHVAAGVLRQGVAAAAPVVVGALPAGVRMDWRKVVHVWCNASSIYPSVSRRWGRRWLPDALADPTYFPGGTVPLEAGVTHSFLVRIHVGRDAVPGTYTGAAVVIRVAELGQTITVPLALTVWDTTLPAAGADDSFATVFNLWYSIDGDGDTKLAPYYGPGQLSTAVKKRYFDLLCEARTPADNPYLSHATGPRPLQDYQWLAACGASKYFNLFDVESLAGKLAPGQVAYNASQISGVLGALAPLVRNLTDLGLVDRAYVYGFDEVPKSHAPLIRQLFGAIKGAYPRLRTMATVRWAPPADGLNIDIWVTLYSLWNSTAAHAFRAGGTRREAWAYHCISPRPVPVSGPMLWLNTFLEMPPIQARELAWWSALHGVDGWLYYLVNGWEGAAHHAHKPLALLEGTSTRTNFSAIRYNPVAVPGDKGAFSNGDGVLIYPGAKGPLSSLRLENFRDGLEDLELLRRLAASDPARMAALAGQVITGFAPNVGVNATGDPAVLEAARLAALAAVQAARGGRG